MRIFIKAKPGARAIKIEKISENSFVVAVTARAEKGRANEAIIAVLAEHFGLAKSRVRLIAGATARQKIFELN